jgi:hypothetical protein
MRFQLQLLTLVVLTFLVRCGRADYTADLHEFAGQDLRRLDENHKARLKSVLAKCLPEGWLDGPLAPKPWFLSPHESGYVLFLARPLWRIPGTSSCEVHFLATGGGHLGSVSFSTGWRIQIEGASFKFDNALGIPVVEVTSAPSINGDDIRRQIYGLFGDHLALLRLEDSEGNLVQNDYYHPNHTIGPRPLALAAEDWEQLLRGGDLARVLEALNWIGGDHRLDPTPPPANWNLEKSDSVKQVTEVRGRPESRREIERLTKSEHPWVQEAARVAFYEIDDDGDASWSVDVPLGLSRATMRKLSEGFKKP